jgi:hypothetical protein
MQSDANTPEFNYYVETTDEHVAHIFTGPNGAVVYSHTTDDKYPSMDRHLRHPKYIGEAQSSYNCEYINQPCYCDGSTGYGISVQQQVANSPVGEYIIPEILERYYNSL